MTMETTTTTNGAAAAPTPPPAEAPRVLREYTQPAYVPVTEAERLECSLKARKLRRRAEEYLADGKAAMKTAKANAEICGSEAAELEEIAEEGERLSSTVAHVDEAYDAAGVVRCRRKDTGAVVSERALRPDERQLGLPLDAKPAAQPDLFDEDEPADEDGFPDPIVIDDPEAVLGETPPRDRVVRRRGKKG